MAHPRNSFIHSPPQSLHTQESGEAGLSSYMKHQFNDHCNKSALAEPERGSSVIPIPKESLDDFPPQTPSEVETFKVLATTTAIAEGHVAEEGEDSCSKMAGSSKCPPLAAGGRRRKSKRCRKKAPMYLFCMTAFTIILLSGDLPAGANPVADQEPKCFACKDKDRCPNLINIFETVEDTHLYQRGLNENFPECSGVSPPLNKSCAVCRDQSGIVILCSKDVGPRIDVEDTDQIDVFPTACVHQSKGTNVWVGPGITLLKKTNVFQTLELHISDVLAPCH